MLYILMILRATKATTKIASHIDGGIGERLPSVLRAGMVGLAVSVGLAFQIPVSICRAQGTCCFCDSVPPDESPQYFPKGVFDERGSFIAPTSACVLRAVDEKPLIPATSLAGGGVYRLTVSPSWGPSLFVIRLEVRSDGTGLLVKKEARRADPVGITKQASQDVPKGDVEVFERLLEKASFWSMPTLWGRHYVGGRWVFVDELGGIVGDLEGARAGAYHVVTRHVHYKPTPGEPYDELTSYLFQDLGHFEIPPIPSIPSKHKRQP